MEMKGSLNNIGEGFLDRLQESLPEGVSLVVDFPSRNFLDGKIYVSCGRIAAGTESAFQKEVIWGANGADGFFREYEAADAVSSVSAADCPAVMAGLAAGMDILVPLFTPDTEQKIYLMASSGGNLHAQAEELSCIAARLTGLIVTGIMANLAVNDSELCAGLFSIGTMQDRSGVPGQALGADLVSTDEEDDVTGGNLTGKRILDTDMAAIIRKIFPFAGMVAGAGAFGGAMPMVLPSPDDKEVTDIVPQMSSAEEFVEYCRKARKKNDPDFIQNLSRMMEPVSMAGIIRFITGLPARQQKEFFENCLDRKGLAVRSEIKVEIRRFNATDPKKRNDGMYRIFLKKHGQEPRLLHFAMKNHTVLYVMYLIDRKRRGDAAESIDFWKNKESFIDLYLRVYGDIVSEGEAAAEYRYLTNRPEPPVNNCFKGINRVVKMTVQEFDESFTPFRVVKTGHLAVLPENIIIPEELQSVLIAD